MTLSDWIEYGKNTLKQAGITDFESDTKILAQYAFGLSFTDLFLRAKEEMGKEAEASYKECIRLRKTHMPCQYITGTQMFMGYEFSVAPGVLIPRQETELLVEEALRQAEDFSKDTLHVLDLCCGSGCIGLSFLCERRKKGYLDDTLLLADISDEALRLSEKNRRNLGIKCSLVKSDIFSGIDEKFDMILSNPPYIRSADLEELMEEVRDFEPRLALDGTENGLFFYDKIIREAGKYLNDGGKILFEIGYDQFEDVGRLLSELGFSDVKLLRDYAGLDRVAAAEYKKSGS